LELALHMGDQFIAAGGGAWAQDHFGMHGFSPLLVRHTDYRRHENGRMRRERRFDLHGIDVETSADDHVLHAVYNKEIAQLVDVAEVARAPGAVDELGGGLFGITIIARHNGAAAD